MNVRDLGQNTVNCALIQAVQLADSNGVAGPTATTKDRMNRLDALRKQIEAGTYCPSAEDIAVAIFQRTASDK
ncbi:MAG: flagellar biosynthesis anti-sigma factor FlgM [Fimbriimonadaceae bacterium]